jgi:hypothetical protein
MHDNNARERKNMLPIVVVNPKHDRFGQVIMVAREDWTSGKYWLPCTLNGRPALISRYSLGGAEHETR